MLICRVIRGNAAWLAFALTALLGGCGGSEQTSVTETESATVVNATDLYGTYRTTLDPSEPDIPHGVWELKIAPGRYSVTNLPLRERHRGEIIVSGSKLTITTEPPGCADRPGRYSWTLKGSTLQLTPAQPDLCAGGDRSVVLTSRPWTKE